MLAVFLCIFFLVACASRIPSPDVEVDVEEENQVEYQEDEPDVLDDYPEEPEEPEEYPEDDEPEEEPKPEETPSPPAQSNDAAGGTQQQQNQQPAPAQEQQQPAPQQAPAEAQPQPAATPAAAGSVTGSEFEMEVIRLVNVERQRAGLGQLTANSLLMSGARIRAEEIDVLFSHDRPNGSSWRTVLSDLGYTRTPVGENIAAGQTSPSMVVNSWMGSQGHRNNILGSAYTEIGVGAVVGSDGRWYWVQLFGGGGGAGASGSGAAGSQGQASGQGSGTSWVPPRAQYNISAPSSGNVRPGDVLILEVVTSDPSVPFTVSWSAPRQNFWWYFRDGIVEIFDYPESATPALNARVTVFEFGNPVAEISVTLNFR